MSVYPSTSNSDWHLSSCPYNPAKQLFLIWSASSDFLLSWWPAANSLLRLSWMGSAASKSMTSPVEFLWRLQSLANISACSRLLKRLMWKIYSCTSSRALMQVITSSEKSLGPSLMIFFCIVLYAVVWYSVSWKPTVAEVLKLLLNLIDWAELIISVKHTFYPSGVLCAMCMSSASCVSCMLHVSGIAGWAVMFEGLGDFS